MPDTQTIRYQILSRQRFAVGEQSMALHISTGRRMSHRVGTLNVCTPTGSVSSGRIRALLNCFMASQDGSWLTWSPSETGHCVISPKAILLTLPAGRARGHWRRGRGVNGCKYAVQRGLWPVCRVGVGTMLCCGRTTACHAAHRATCMSTEHRAQADNRRGTIGHLRPHVPQRLDHVVHYVRRMPVIPCCRIILPAPYVQAFTQLSLGKHS